MRHSTETPPLQNKRHDSKCGQEADQVGGKEKKFHKLLDVKQCPPVPPIMKSVLCEIIVNQLRHHAGQHVVKVVAMQRPAAGIVGIKGNLHTSH